MNAQNSNQINAKLNQVNPLRSSFSCMLTLLVYLLACFPSSETNASRPTNFQLFSHTPVRLSQLTSYDSTGGWYDTIITNRPKSHLNVVTYS